MLNISNALNADAVQTYHKQFTSEVQNYYKQGNTVQGEWQGELAAKFGLAGKVGAEEFARLTEGQHPESGEQMVKHRTPQQQVAADGTVTNAVAHRAGWDAQFAPPKSVSLTALVGGDNRVREAHDYAVSVALGELERYTQARLGGNHAAQTTGNFIAAKFEHDTARPVDGYAAPQLHTHVVIFNMTQQADGSMRALQPKSLFDSQNFATAVYQSTLTYKLRDLGYELEVGRSGAPEIKGYSQAYLDASSLRSQQIKERLEQLGLSGPAAAQFAAYATRSGKQDVPPAEVLAAHKEMAVAFGNQPDQVIAAARERSQTQQRSPDRKLEARQAVSYARTHNFEREAVTDERGILRDAMRRGMGEATYAEIKAEFDSRLKNGDFVEREAKKHDTGRRFTTPETIAAERANIAHVHQGQNAAKPIMTKLQATVEASFHPKLNAAQHRVIEEVLTSKDRVHGLEGLAGTGKTTTLKAIRQGAERQGYAVEGFAPTSKAAGALRAAGIEATTLQSFLLRKPKETEKSEKRPKSHLYMLDESSLASTQQMKQFLDKLKPEDRVLVIGDTRQHQGVDAGKPFEQMRDAGMKTSRLDQIMRQRDSPELLQAVQKLAEGKVEEGVALLGKQGRITEIRDANARIAAIAKDYVAQPANTLIVSPDNRSRQLINDAVRAGLRESGALAADGQQFTTLAHRSDMTGSDRTWAAKYQPGDTLKYTKGRQSDGLEKNSYATVTSVDARANTLTVRQEDGRSLTYDPRRLQGVNVYVEQKQELATGDRIQFTSSEKWLGVSNRDLGTVTKLECGKIEVRMDGKDARTVTFDPSKMRHFDHGYAVTSHSSQGLTQSRVLANIDTDSSRSLINSRLAYVAISRASTDARIYTNRAETLGARLATDISKSSAVDFSKQTKSTDQKSSLEDYATFWLKDYKAAITPGAKIEPLPLRGNILDKVVTLAIDSEPARVKRVLNLLSHGSTDNKSTPPERKKTTRDQREPPNVREYADPDHRLAAVAADYLARPKGTVIVAPDRNERQEVTKLIRADLQAQGRVSPDAQSMTVLTKHNVRNPKLATDYTPGDRIHFRRGDKQAGIDSNSTAVVIASEAKSNQLTVRTVTGDDVTYRPHLTKAVTAQSTVYRAEQREIAPGDRIQITEADGKNGFRRGDLGTVIRIDGSDLLGTRLELRLDKGKTVPLDAAQARHIDHGYAVESAKTSNIARVLMSRDTLGSTPPGELAVLSRAKEATLYVSDATQQPAVPQKQKAQQAAEPVVRQYADPNHRLAAVAADYAARPQSTVIVARDPAERKDLTQLIRADLQAKGLVSPDARSMTVLIKEEVSNPKLAAEYTPGHHVHYNQGNKEAGIASNTAAVVIANDAKTNKLTVRVTTGEEIVYSPQLTKSMTTQSTVYRAEQREIAPGDRVQITKADGDSGLRLGDFGNVTKIHDKNAGLELRLDNGKAVALNAAQAQHLEYGYAVESIKARNIARVLVSQDAIGSTDPRELAALFRAKETTLYISESPQLKQPAVPVQALQVEKAQVQVVHAQAPAQAAATQALPVPQSQAPENIPVPDAPAVQQRHGMRHYVFV